MKRTYRTLREHRLFLGLCEQCDDPPEPGRKRCRKHLDRATNGARRRRDERDGIVAPAGMSPLAEPPAISVRDYWSRKSQLLLAEVSQ